ncbi:MAG: transposase, partial [Caldisphaera sp.]
YNYFVYNREEFMQHYHLRSNVESTNFMIKSKFGDFIRSKDKTAQVNEVLLKILCHNIVVLIHEMNELGIEANFLAPPR